MRKVRGSILTYTTNLENEDDNMSV